MLLPLGSSKDSLYHLLPSFCFLIKIVTFSSLGLAWLGFLSALFVVSVVQLILYSLDNIYSVMFSIYLGTVASIIQLINVLETKSFFFVQIRWYFRFFSSLLFLLKRNIVIINTIIIFFTDCYCYTVRRCT